MGVSVDFWQVLPVAIALVFVIEGLLPFLSPNRWRAMLAIAQQVDERTIRYLGLGSMVFGVGILYLVH
jgi:uncharacterized protein YjeT (DUF2065 family)